MSLNGIYYHITFHAYIIAPMVLIAPPGAYPMAYLHCLTADELCNYTRLIVVIVMQYNYKCADKDPDW